MNWKGDFPLIKGNSMQLKAMDPFFYGDGSYLS